LGDQRIGRQREHLVKQIEGQQVGRKGHADGRRNGDGKRGEIAGLRMLLERAHVADGIERGEEPEDRSDQGKEHPHGIDPQRQRHPGQHFGDDEFVAAAGQNRGQQGDDDGHLAQRCQQGPALAQIGRAPRQDCRQRPDGSLIVHRIDTALSV
jgi:hypothetical protein